MRKTKKITAAIPLTKETDKTRIKKSFFNEYGISAPTKSEIFCKIVRPDMMRLLPVRINQLNKGKSPFVYRNERQTKKFNR